MQIELADRQVGPGHPCFIIAEAGVNHNGEIGLAKQLVDVAAEAGADAIKFQTFRADRVVSAATPKAKYQLQTTDASESQREMLQRLELSREAHHQLQAYCQEQNILFMSTPFDQESADLLDELRVPLFKIGSGEITNWPFLEYVARKGKPIILSTGMSYLSEVDEAVRVIRKAGNGQLILLHCVSSYPAEPEDVNLRAMQTMSVAFKALVGYSDHTLGIEVPLAAVALGACVIEKHFTLDRNLPGPDQRASLEPKELRTLVTKIRMIESALGDGVKRPTCSEADSRSIVRRSLAAVQEIPAGTALQAQMLQALRPATGISPTLLAELLGRRVRRSLAPGELISWKDLA